MIQEFVLRRAPHFIKEKRENNTIEIYLDILVLPRFGRGARMSRHAVLKRFHQYKTTADSFIDFHMKR